jgi:trimethylamine---corrinoid protein Co-methyltransferase
MDRSSQVGRLRREGLLLDVLTDDDLKDIHYATLEVLERTGMFIEADDARDIYRDGGCEVDDDERRVRIPPHLVEDAIRWAPATVYGSGRDGVGDGLGQVGRIDFVNFSEGICYVDPDTGEWRSATKADVCDVARLVDALDWMGSYANAIGALDTPPETAHLHGLEAALLNTTKCCAAMVNDAWELRKCWELAAIVMGGEEELRKHQIVNFGGGIISPLKMPHEVSDLIIESARLGACCTIATMPLTGATAPMSIAGTLLMNNSEVLAGVVLSQLVNRGTPVYYGTSAGAMDLRHTTVPMGSPEAALIGAAVAQIGRYYELPCMMSGL